MQPFLFYFVANQLCVCFANHIARAPRELNFAILNILRIFALIKINYKITMTVDNEKAIRAIVKSSVKTFAGAFAEKHLL